MTRMAGYVRVSTPRQVEQGDSLDVQADRLTAEAKKRGWTLTLYREEGISAKDDHRPEYQRMRADLEAGTVAGVVATKLDRLWRSMRLAVNEIHTITDEWGRSLVVLDQKYDTTTSSGRFALNIFLSAGQFERELTADRVGEAMRARAEQGRWNGGTVPFGFARGKQKGTLVIKEADAKVVRRIYELYLNKRSIRRVVHLINGAGIKAPFGGTWCVKSVRHLLKNPLYIGTLVYNKMNKHSGNGKPTRRPEEERIAKPGAVPAIVDKATWEAVQKVLRAGSLLHPRAIASDFLLTGLVKCGRCAGGMTGWSVPGPKGRRQYRYYRCWQGFEKGKRSCPGNTIRAEVLESHVLQSLFDLQTDPARLRASMKEQRVRERQAVTPLAQRVGRLESELQKCAGREAQINLAYETGAYGKGPASVKKFKQRLADLAAEKEKREATLAEAKAQLGSAKLDTFDAEHVLQALQNAFEVYEELEFEDQRSLMHNVIGEVRIGPTGGSVTLKDTGGVFSGAGKQGFTYNKRKRDKLVSRLPILGLARETPQDDAADKYRNRG